ERVLPNMATQLLAFAKMLGRKQVFLSVYENGSSDNTKSILQAFERTVKELGIPHSIVTDSRQRPQHYHRIEYMADIRNRALEALYNSTAYNRVVFLNDVYFCLPDLLELLHQSQFHRTHLTCAEDFDMRHGSLEFYDTWVSRDMLGRAFKSRYQSIADDNMALAGQVHNRPFQAQCCWNGMAVLDAQVFDGPKALRFRRSSPGECSASECSLLCNDLWKTGRRRVVVVPRVKVAYNIETRDRLRQPLSFPRDAPFGDQPLREITFRPGPKSVYCNPLNDAGSTMDWQPEPESLQQLIQLLNSTNMADNAIQQQNNQRLEQLSQVPDFINYLLYVLVCMKDESSLVRTVAGLLLKNKVRQDFKQIPRTVLEYVVSKSIDGIGDPITMVRHTLGTVVATVVALGKVSSWPDVLPRLLQLLDSGDYTVVEGSWDILHKICEECDQELEEPLADGTRPLSVMIPKFLTFFGAESPVLREYAISTTTLFVTLRSESMQPMMDTFVVELFKRANDENAEVLKSVCKAVVALVDSRPDKLMPELENVVNYMIHTTQHSDPDIAMEACEFWLSFCEQKELVESLKPFLNRVVPTLMRGMVYSEEDLLMLDNDDNDAV
ncbi:hypothetical protein LPJ77_005503, partial [Coemansia sp. RSA 2523]